MSRTIFYLIIFRESSASYLFILHDLISVAVDDESAMNPRQIREKVSRKRQQRCMCEPRVRP